MKKITLHGPAGQGTANDQYFFTLVDANGDVLAQSEPFSNKNNLMQAVVDNFGVSRWDIDASDLGEEAPNTLNVKSYA